MTHRKKLIEVAMPLETINREAAREKSIRHGHPSTLHLWWARRPLAACRAVLCAALWPFTMVILPQFFANRHTAPKAHVRDARAVTGSGQHALRSEVLRAVDQHLRPR